MPDRLKAILEKIKEGNNIALISDAGTPIIYYGCSNSCIGYTGCRDDQTYDGSADNL